MNTKVTGPPRLGPFLSAVAGLIYALGQCEDLPEPVMTAAGLVQREVAALTGRDIGPPP